MSLVEFIDVCPHMKLLDVYCEKCELEEERRHEVEQDSQDDWA